MTEKERKTLEEEKNFGLAKRRELRIAQLAALVAMAVLMIVLTSNVNLIQGNARVINFAGMVRGGTQKLVKEELYGVQDDQMLAQMDDILYSLRTGEGRYGDIRLADETYQEALTEQVRTWDSLKAEILAYRADPSDRVRLFELSQSYFQIADKTVSMAQDYSAAIENRIENIKWIVVVLLALDALILALYGVELGKATKHNKKLSDIAYTDPCTGLSNKRKCAERLANREPIPPETELTCFMFDINNLKKMNDAHGHEAGDLLIAGFGEALRQEALPHMFLGRFGGDEFMAVAVGLGAETAAAFEERLRANCGRRTVAGVAGISFACGSAVSTEFPGLDISALMQIADQRMYENKKVMKANDRP